MKHFFFYFVVFILCQSNVFAQDTVIFVSGDRLPVYSYQNDSVDNNYYIIKTLKGKYKNIHKEEIFSFIKKTGGEEVIFQPFTSEGMEFSSTNMRIYIKGEQEARKNSGTFLATTTSFVIGAATPILLSYSGNKSLFYSPIPIALTNFVVGLTIPTERSVIRKYPELGSNEFFNEGYRMTAKNKRLNKSIKSSIIGLGVGIISSIIISNNTN